MFRGRCLLRGVACVRFVGFSLEAAPGCMANPNIADSSSSPIFEGW